MTRLDSWSQPSICEAGDALVELGVNPLRVHPEGEGCTVLDAAAVVSMA
jgi:hypothetical protein